MIKLGVPHTDMKANLNIVNTNEAEAVAMAAGITLAGGDSYVYMQDDGYLNAINVLFTLVMPYNIPIFINVYFRGDGLEHHKKATELVKYICASQLKKTLYI